MSASDSAKKLHEAHEAILQAIASLEGEDRVEELAELKDTAEWIGRLRAQACVRASRHGAE